MVGNDNRQEWVLRGRYVQSHTYGHAFIFVTVLGLGFMENCSERPAWIHDAFVAMGLRLVILTAFSGSLGLVRNSCLRDVKN
jgi:hypothetical protein